MIVYHLYCSLSDLYLQIMGEKGITAVLSKHNIEGINSAIKRH